MAKKLGKDCKFYYADSLLTGEAGGEAADLSWNVVDNLRDLTLNLETGEADVKTRGSDWEQTKATFKNGSIDFEMLWETGDAAFDAIKDAWLNGDEIALAAMDADIDTSDSEGLVSNFSVTNFSRNEPLEEGVSVSVTVKPSSQTEWYEVA